MRDENREVILKIGGMNCVMCVKTVENSLQSLPGVTRAEVSLANEQAVIVYDPRLLSKEELRRAVETVGFQFLGVEGGDEPETGEEIIRRDMRKKRLRISVGSVSGLFLMAVMMLKITLHPFEARLLMVFSLTVSLYVSYPIFRASQAALKLRSLTMDVMYSLGIGASMLASLLAVFRVISHHFLLFDSVILLATFLHIGRYLEARARRKTSTALEKLLAMQPKTARVIRGEREEELPVSMVQKGDRVRIRPGERIPVDGVVAEGESHVDESWISGESMPVKKRSGDSVTGGSINTNGTLLIRAEKLGQDSFLAQIIRLVRQAQVSKPSVQRLADRVIAMFIPIILALALLSFLVWLIVGQTIIFAFTVFISILVVSCPCALGLATPTAVIVGIGRGAELGILIKNGEALEMSEKVTRVLFDKTGTLTAGRPEVEDIISEGRSEADLLQAAASLESLSEHPLAGAVVRKAQEKNVAVSQVSDFFSEPGKGVSGRIDGTEIFLGSRKWMREKKLPVSSAMEERIDHWQEEGKTVVLIAQGNCVWGGMSIADRIKENAPAAVSMVKNMGVKVTMISGDQERSARAVGEKLGIEEVNAEVLPDEKAAIVARLQKNGERVVFVGDGINDAPALAQADVGITVGAGTDIAMESGDIVLIRDDLRDVPASLQLSRKVMQRIRQNLFWAFAYNLILLPLAGGVLYPFFKILVPPAVAAFAMALSSITVVSLSLWLKRFTPPARESVE